MERIIVPQLKKKTISKQAYQLEEKSGGFQLFQINLSDEGNFVSRERISDPDGWEQVITLLERELSKQFA